MRYWAALALMVAVFIPPAVLAQSIPVSSIHVAYSTLRPGQTQTVTVIARDLRGRPLAGARAGAKVEIGKRTTVYRMKATDRTGKTLLVLHTASNLANVRVTVHVSVTNGFISIPLSTAFTIRASGAAGTPSATPVRTPTATRTPTGSSKKSTATPVRTALAPTATAIPTPTSPGSSGQLVLVPKAVPGSVTAPAPAWIVVYAHTTTGPDVPGVLIHVVAPFIEGAVAAVGETDSTGVASIMIDTSEVRTPQTVSIHVSAQNGAQTASSSTPLTMTAPAPTATPPAVPPVLPTLTPTGTALTATAGPTATAVPTPTRTPVPTPTITPTGTPVPNCPGDMQSCMQVMLGILNQTRAQYGVAPLSLNQTQSLGAGSCVGSLGHSKAMQQSGTIWHINGSYPSASFPNDICVSTSSGGENVGEAQTGDEVRDLNMMHNEMMSEPYTPGCQGTHICNILSTQFTQVGIGVYNYQGITWLTEDFIH